MVNERSYSQWERVGNLSAAPISAPRFLPKTVALGHIIVRVPFAMATLIPRFEGLDAAIEQTSADLDEDMWWTFWRVIFPFVFPGVVQACSFVSPSHTMSSLRRFPETFFLTVSKEQTRDS